MTVTLDPQTGPAAVAPHRLADREPVRLRDVTRPGRGWSVAADDARLQQTAAGDSALSYFTRTKYFILYYILFYIIIVFYNVQFSRGKEKKITPLRLLGVAEVRVLRAARALLFIIK